MKKMKVSNFSKWLDEAKRKGTVRSQYPAFDKNANFAELMGVVLGDGHIYKFPRTEELSIFSNSKNKGFVKRYSDLVEKIFDQEPAITKHGRTNCTRIRIYQKHISKRLGVPYSPRKALNIKIPRWVLNNRGFIVRYLRGLYEAEGAHCVHESTGTYKVFFTNRNVSMLTNVYRLVKKLGFHPHTSKYQVQISRKDEVSEFLGLIEFRKY